MLRSVGIMEDRDQQVAKLGVRDVAIYSLTEIQHATRVQPASNHIQNTIAHREELFKTFSGLRAHCLLQTCDIAHHEVVFQAVGARFQDQGPPSWGARAGTSYTGPVVSLTLAVTGPGG